MNEPSVPPAAAPARDLLQQQWQRSVGRAPTVGLTVAAIGGAVVVGGVLTGGLQRWMALAIVAAIAPLAGLLLHRERSTSRRLEALINTSGAVFWELSLPDCVFRAIVGPVEAFAEVTTTQLMGRPVTDVIHRDDIDGWNRALEVVTDDGKVVWESRVGQPSTGWNQFRHHIDRVPVRGGHVLRGVSFDITAMHRAHLALSRYADIVQHSRDALLVTRYTSLGDPTSLIVLEANDACEAVLGIDDTQLIDRPLLHAVPWLDTPVVHQALEELDDVEPSVSLAQLAVVGTDRLGAVDLDISLLPDGALAVTARDVTDQVLSERTIRHQAEHDELTGLANRGLFMSHLREVLSAQGVTFGLMIVDLDRFKEVNDTLGHGFGDRLLQAVADRIRGVVRDGDMVARLGGDEFAVLLVGTQPSEAEAIGERVSEACCEPLQHEGLQVSVAASVGMVLSPDHGRDLTTLLRRADLTMYEAKRAGGGIAVFDPGSEALTASRLDMSGELSRGLDEGEFRLWFQPKIDLHSGDMIGAEGLVRWDHPTRGSLLPAEFLGLLDVSGYMDRLTAQVIEQAAALAARCANLGRPMDVAVNLAARNLYDERLPDQLGDVLSRFDLDPASLILEITESDIMADLALTEPVLDRLNRLGVPLSIDDFGTGHSSLSRLRRLPVTEIKIDRSFVAPMAENESDAVIVRSIIDLAHNLGLRTVAEGVEDAATRDMLIALGCDAAQGWYFSAPMPAGVFLSHLRRTASTG